MERAQSWNLESGKLSNSSKTLACCAQIQECIHVVQSLYESEVVSKVVVVVERASQEISSELKGTQNSSHVHPGNKQVDCLTIP